MKKMINFNGKIPYSYSNYSDFTGKYLNHTIYIDGVNVTNEVIGHISVSNSGETISETNPKTLSSILNGGEHVKVIFDSSDMGTWEEEYSYPYAPTIENILNKVQFIYLYELNGQLYPSQSDFNPDSLPRRLYKIINVKPFSLKREMVNQKGLEVFVTDEFMFKNPLVKSFKLVF